MRVSLEIGGEVLHLLDWNSGETDTNRLGPTVNLILPDVNATEMTLRLESGEASSVYRLRYRMSKALAASRQMNV